MSYPISFALVARLPRAFSENDSDSCVGETAAPSSTDVGCRHGGACRHRLMLGALSAHPLLGFASLYLTVSSNVTGLYMGVKDPRGVGRAFIRVTNLRREDVTGAFGVSELSLTPRFAASCHRIQAGARHLVDLRWKERYFHLCLDGQGVVSGAAQPLLAAPTFVFIWSFAHHQLSDDDLLVTPCPLQIDADAAVACGLCNGTRSLSAGCWAVGPRCYTWVCRHRVEDSPFALCSRYDNVLDDYIGGADTPSLNQDNIMQPHLSARGSWQKFQAGRTDGDE